MISRVTAASLKRSAECFHIWLSTFDPSREYCRKNCGATRRTPTDFGQAERQTINIKPQGVITMTTQTVKSAADARKGLNLTPVKLTIEILPNIALEAKGDWAKLTLEGTRRVVNMVPHIDKATGVTTIKDESFNVHDVTYLEGSIAYMLVGQEKTRQDLKANERVSLKGNARLDRGFAKMTAGQSVFIEYLGKVEAGKGREANDYDFGILA